MIIYKITNKIDGKSYVGQTTKNVDSRFREHCRPSSLCVRLSRAIKKYGRDNFEVEILCRCSSKEEMNHMETNYIKSLDTLSPNGYNLNLGGDSRLASEDTKRKMSLSQKGKRLGSANGMYGKKHTEENKQKMSSTRKGKFLGYKNPMFGTKLNEEKRLALAMSRKGKKNSDKQKSAASKANKGKRFSESHLKNLSSANDFRKIKILCLNNDKEYNSIMEASRDLLLSSGNISKVLSGKGKSVKGFIFIKVEI